MHKKRGEVAMKMDEGYELPNEVSGLIDFVSDFLVFKTGIKTKKEKKKQLKKY